MSEHSDGKGRQAMLHLERAEAFMEGVKALNDQAAPTADARRRTDTLAGLAASSALVGLLCEAEAIRSVLGELVYVARDWRTP